MKRLLSWSETKKYTNEAGELELPSVLESKFDPQNRLEELLVEAGYDPVARPAFEKLLLDHEVLVAIRDDGQPDGPLGDVSAPLGVYTLLADDGDDYPVSFTAQDRGYECLGPATVMAMMTGRQLLEMVSETGVWMNPSSPFGVLWKSEDLKRILSS